ncbi:AAWKG family protein [Streptomyces sp. NPDC087226]|uniref:AAWKG family protein n=1 Tax=Streptomyces sp. NPDC087226 TaxID=3365771 RepID=UPI0038050B31
MPADNWENIIKLMTGWTLPTRAEVTSQQGDSGIKWMNVQIEHHSEPLQVQAQGNVLTPAGAVFNFYEPKGKTRRGLHELGGVRVTVTYTKIELGREFWRRGSAALDILLSNFSTVGAQGEGAPGGNEGVDLRTLTAAARSFDSAGEFFARRTELLKQWGEAMGSENAAWKGTAAEVFRMLLNRLYDKYDNYLSQLRPPGFSPTGPSPSSSYTATTLHGDGLVKAERDLYHGYEKLFDAYYSYYWRQAKELPYQRADGTQASAHFPADPRETLGDLMADIAQWIEAHNYNQVSREGIRFTENQTRGSGSGELYFALGPSFSTSPRWGDLSSTSTWSVIAEEATNRWTRNVEENLDAPARIVATEVSEAWNRTLDPGWNTRFAFQDNGSSSLTEELQAAQAEEEAENARKQQEELTSQIKGLDDNLGGLDENLGGLGENLEKNFGGLGENLEKNLGGLGDKFGTGIDNLTSGFKDVLGGGDNPLSKVSLPEGGTQELGGGPNGTPDMPEMPEFGAGTGTGTGTVTLPDGQTAQIPSSLLANPAGLSLPGGTDGTGSSGSRVELPDGQTMFSPEALGAGTGLGLGLPGIPAPGGPLGTSRGENGTREEFPNGLVQTTLPDGTTSFTTPDGTTTTVGEDGALTSDFADGTRTSVSPDGSWTSVLPDGTTDGGRLEPGEQLTLPDGSTTGLGPDGGLTTTLPDGSSYTVGPDGASTVELPDGTTRETFPNGLVQTTLPDGTTSFTTPDGTTTTVGEDGALTSDFADGTRTSVSPDGSWTSVLPDGTTDGGRLEPGEQLTLPDGSTTGLGPDGGLTTTLPDGSSYTVGPDGTVTTHGTDGSGRPPIPLLPDSLTSDGLGVNLPEGGTDGLGNLGDTTTFPDGTTAVTSPDGYTTTTFPDGSSTVRSPNGELQALPSPATAEAAALTADPGSAATAGAQGAAPGLGVGADPGLANMMGPMMMMMGMSRMGQQQQQNGNQERVREVYEDDTADGVYLAPPPGRQSARAEEDVYEEEEEDSPELLDRPVAASPSGYARPATQGGGWGADEEDAWGTREGGLPASLGR